MKTFEKVMYPVLVILLMYFMYTSMYEPEHFKELAKVGGLIQWLTILTLIFASFICFYRAHILKPFRGTFFATCSILFGILYLVFALDEMSWGQLMFHFESPNFFKLRNAFGETNLRHLTFLGTKLSDIVFTVFIKVLATIYFVIIPFAYTKIPSLKKLLNRFSVPVPRYFHTISYVLVGLSMYSFPVEYRSYVFEFVFYWFLVLLMYHPLNDEVFRRRSLVR